MVNGIYAVGGVTLRRDDVRALPEGQVRSDHQCDNLHLKRFVSVVPAMDDDGFTPPRVGRLRPKLYAHCLYRDLFDRSLAKMSAIPAALYNDKIAFSGRVTHLNGVDDVSVGARRDAPVHAVTLDSLKPLSELFIAWVRCHRTLGLFKSLRTFIYLEPISGLNLETYRKEVRLKALYAIRKVRWTSASRSRKLSESFRARRKLVVRLNRALNCRSGNASTFRPARRAPIKFG